MARTPRPAPPATFFKLYLDHVRERAAIIFADATMMALIQFPPLVFLLTTKVYDAWGGRQNYVNACEIIDGLWMVLAVGTICLDSLGKIFVVAWSGWRDMAKKKHEQAR
jgi:hypothetical protein